jgi:hypothetical protein
MADDELFYRDGTEPLPAAPLLPDPLSGLLTGVSFSDTMAPAEAIFAGEPERQAAAQPAAAIRRRVQQAAPRRSSAPGATTPTAIPVAESLPSRPTREARRPVTTNRPAQVPVTPAVRTQRTPPVRPLPTRQPIRQPTRQAPRNIPVPTTRRRSGSGCGLFLIIVVLLLVAFVVLGVVLGHGAGGFGGG